MPHGHVKCPYCNRNILSSEPECHFCEADLTKVKEKHEKPHCFIATAAYGTPFAEEINILRDWRDNTLNTNILGKLFIKIYYKTSPPIARMIEKSNFLKKLTRITLKPIIKIIKNK